MMEITLYAVVMSGVFAVMIGAILCDLFDQTPRPDPLDDADIANARKIIERYKNGHTD